MLELHEIRALSTWTRGSTYTISQEDWDKYTEFHVYIGHGNTSNPDYYEMVFNKAFFNNRITGYGTANVTYVIVLANVNSRTLTLYEATNQGNAYNPLAAIFAR